jgi:hypothetical protein
VDYNFRVRFDFVEGDRLISDDSHVRFDGSSAGETFTLRSGAASEAISSRSTASILGGPYANEEAAHGAAEWARDTLLIWSVRNRLGIDMGDGHLRSLLTEAGRLDYEKALGKPVRGDLQGIDVYPANDDTAFLRAECKTAVGRPVDAFITDFRRIGSRSWQPTEKQRVAAELFCASFFDRVFRSRFITLVTAVEALLQPGRRSDAVQDIIEKAKALARALAETDSAKDALLSGLERLRKDSIGHAGRELADRLLEGRTYDNLGPGSFFAKCLSG